MTYDEVMARLQLKLLELSEKPEEEQLKAIAFFEKMEKSLQGLGESILALNMLFGIAPPSAEGIERDEEPTLCESCANPCIKGASSNVPIYTCKDYSTFVAEKCATCQNWDVDTCQLPEPCIDGQHYVELGPEETDEAVSV